MERGHEDLKRRVPQGSLLGGILTNWLARGMTPEGLRKAGMITDAGLADLREQSNRAAVKVADPGSLLYGD